MSQTPVLPPGWIAQWDQQAGRNLYVETSTGRSSWQPPNAPLSPGQRPTHNQGAARMSMPPMQGPPGMRPPPSAMGPTSPGIPEGATSPPPSGIQGSRRRAYPTAHMAANSVSYSGGFDAGAQAAAGSGFTPSAGMAPLQENQPQFFTPGVPEAAPAAANPYAAGVQQPQPQQQNGQPMGGQGGYPGAAAGAGAGMAGLTNQFSNMGVAGQRGVSTG